MSAAERWLPVTGYQGLYEVSDLGQVRSLPRPGCPGRVLRPQANNTGTVYVSLSAAGQIRSAAVQRLVAEAFLGPQPPRTRIRHRDGDKAGCALANLSYQPAVNTPERRREPHDASRRKAARPRPGDKPDTSGAKIDRLLSSRPGSARVRGKEHGTRLTVLPGGGEPCEPCTLCGSHYGPCKALAAHLDHLRQRGHSAGSIYSRKRFLARLGAALPVPVLDATPADLAAWRASLNVARVTVRTYISHAQSFFAWACDTGRRDDNSNPATGLPVPRKVRRLPRPIPEDELMRAVESAPPRIRVWLVLAAWCGLRACEIAGLLAEDVMLDARPPVLVVNAASTKGTTERVIPLSPFVAGELAAVLPARGWVFPRYDGAAGPNTAGMTSHLVNEYLHKLGIRSTLHTLRHRFGSSAYKACRDLRAVQELMGHASPDTTSGYAAFDDQSAIDAVNGLPVPPRLRLVQRGAS